VKDEPMPAKVSQENDEDDGNISDESKATQASEALKDDDAKVAQTTDSIRKDDEASHFSQAA